MTEVIRKRDLHDHRDLRSEPVSRPNFALRRTVAVAMLGLASIGVGIGAKAFVTDTAERFSGTDIPNAHDIEENPEGYATYLTEKGDTIDGIAGKYTTGNHDYRVNSDQIDDQLRHAYPEYDGVLQPNQTIYVPITQPSETQDNE